jgi:Tfp pilus assembly protein PilO
MTSASNRKVVFAVLVLFAVCLIALGATLYRRKGNEIAGLQKRLSGERSRLANVREKINRIPELKGKYDRLQARIDFLEPSLPDAAYIPTFLKQIESLAADTGNDILEIRPKVKQKTAKTTGGAVQINSETGEVAKSTEADKKQENAKGAKDKEAPQLPYEFLPIELKMGGTYATAVDFLAALQRFPKMIATNNLSFSPQASQANVYYSPRLTATVELLAVVAKKGDDSGKPR